MIPAWSRRAAAAPALGAFPGSASAFSTSFQLDKSTLSAAGVLVGDEKIGGEAKSSAVEVRSGGAAKPRRSPLDAALAMQLRPGFGLGADGAWLVRFLMSFFGWFAVLVAGGQEFS
ncbi:hypothetical protein B0H16DRAFT_1340854 [Mycena metata]|uniref:Uncharacterized protein n=1 Tax=Mycena metata TaxID=1033252 RepID=A0AAD7MET8_9AGAR|nr:hypothetical protein B0H16DRAFT_1340854 [Mycena metata]